MGNNSKAAIIRVGLMEMKKLAQMLYPTGEAGSCHMSYPSCMFWWSTQLMRGDGCLLQSRTPLSSRALELRISSPHALVVAIANVPRPSLKLVCA